jgi:hypothetical protein
VLLRSTLTEAWSETDIRDWVWTDRPHRAETVAHDPEIGDALAALL